MAEQGVIPRKFAKCAIPACSVCLYAKATRKQWRSKNVKNKVEEMPREPGDLVSIDQLKSPTPGFIAQMCGILTVKRYMVATVFVDQASRFSYVHYQRSATAEETIEATRAFEKMASNNGVLVKNYHADNGIFKANKWMEHCHESGQGIMFAVVNAHHTNGLAERRIRELQDLTRTNMIHANRRWSEAITANLWPYEMRMANESINDTPSLQDKGRRSPRQIFTGTMVNISPKHYKPFGCPVYVLDNALATGYIFHKWKEYSRVGIYLGKSPVHAKNVALVLSMETGHVSPQFHVKFDPSFHTVKENKWSSKWQVLAGFVCNKEPNKKATDNYNFKLYNNKSETQVNHPKKRKAEVIHEELQVSEGDEVVTESEGESSRLMCDLRARRRQQEKTREQQLHEQPDLINQDNTNEPVKTPDNAPAQRELITQETRICTRNGIEGEIFSISAMFPEIEMEKNLLMVMKATSDPDTMYMHEAMREPDKEHFKEAMKKEWRDQLSNGNFVVRHKDDIPNGATILPAVWQMKRKRDIISRAVKKYKARMNIDGSKMHPCVYYDETRTYAPVASWNSVKLLLSMVALHDWHTTQIHYVLA